jgi:hypothetical protein
MTPMMSFALFIGFLTAVGIIAVLVVGVLP